MHIHDNLNFLSSAQVINGSGTSQYSTVIDLQGDNGGTTATGAYGFGAGTPVYFAAYNPVAFTTVTSVNLQLQTSDTLSGGNLSSATTLWASGAATQAQLAGSILWPIVSGGTASQPTYVPVYGCKRYVQILFTVVGPSTAEVGTCTAVLTESVDALQYVTYPISAIA